MRVTASACGSRAKAEVVRMAKKIGRRVLGDERIDA